MLLTHDMRVVIAVLLFANSAVGVLLVWLREHDLRILFAELPNMLVMLGKLLFFVTF